MQNIILIVVGIINLSLMIKIVRDPKFAYNYVKNSPKAFLWRKLFGEERALIIVKKIFVPIGFIIGVCLVVFGIATYFI